ncbi:MAG: SAM hydrolase/SAM-dependent halogenase family protein [Planctomycetota bacterium]
MAKNPIITLTTDFGLAGPYVAAMKGAILRICPQACLIDLTHDVPAHDVWSAAFTLAQAVGEFPDETIHLIVVDPGVGTERSILAAQLGEHRFVFPDNGVITFIKDLLPLRNIVSVRNTQYFLENTRSMTFHGRDIMAPVAAHLASGLEMGKLGPQPSRYTLLEIPLPQTRGPQVVGQVVYVDHFGNCVSNIPQQMVEAHFAAPDRIEVFCNDQPVGPVEGTYGFVQPQRSLALYNSMSMLEVAVNQGRACDRFAAGIGAEVRLQELQQQEQLEQA